jgi:hypothetical protein
MLQHAHISLTGSTVWKLEYKTGLTEGRLSATCHYIPNTPEDPLDKKGTPYYGVILWAGEQNPFAESGDSGALVYLQLEHGIVPIRIHQGSVGTRSFCLLLN